jgi:hypothetical protein
MISFYIEKTNPDGKQTKISYAYDAVSSYGQQLANRLCALVNAPDNYMWYNPNGSTLVAPALGGNLNNGPDLANKGTVQTFKPTSLEDGQHEK